MGVLCSSEVSGTCFNLQVEDRWIDSRGIVRRFGLLFYGRYEDDILIISTASDADMTTFQRILAKRSRCFELKLESVSTISCDVLDFTIFKGERWRHSKKLDFKLYSIPTSNWQPLAPSSCHHPSVHHSWPRAMHSRFLNLSSNAKFAQSSLNSFTAALVSRCGPYDLTIVPRTPNLKPDSQSRCQDARRSVLVFPRLIIPYRHQWHYARLSNAINTCAEKWFSGSDRIIVCWRLAGGHIFVKLRPLNDEFQSLPHFEFHSPLKGR